MTKAKAHTRYKLPDGKRLCSRCKEIKGGDEFYKGNWCMECRRRSNRESRDRNIEYCREYDRRRNTGKRKAEGLLRLKTWKKNNPEKVKESTYRLRREDPIQYKAHYTISNYLAHDKLEKEPCVICGNEDSLAHHEDYEKPLEIIWMCQKCHRFYHFGRLSLDKIKSTSAI